MSHSHKSWALRCLSFYEYQHFDARLCYREINYRKVWLSEVLLKNSEHERHQKHRNKNELPLIGDIGGNLKCFYKYIKSKRVMEESLGLFPK